MDFDAQISVNSVIGTKMYVISVIWRKSVFALEFDAQISVIIH